MSCSACSSALGLSLIGVPDATLWGALAAILRYIPYVGTGIAGLLPVIFAVAIFPHWRQVFEIVGPLWRA